MLQPRLGDGHLESEPHLSYSGAVLNSDRLRVAITLDQCWQRVPGGTARSAIELSAALATRGIVAPIGVAAHHRNRPEPSYEPPIETRSLPLPSRALYEAWHTFGRPRVERATGPVDVVHATGGAVPPRRSPLMVTIHDLAFLHYPDHPTRWGRRFFRRSTEAARRRADMIVCPSNATARDCLDAGFDTDRVRVVPWGASQEIATTDEIRSVRSAFDLPDRFVLFTGTIEPRKNLPRLLDAHRRISSDVPLIIAGPLGWNEDLAAHARGVESSVRMLGFVPPRQLRALYAAATVFCYPSLLEGFGLPVLEAMVQATPVVTSAATSTEEVAGPAGLLVDPHDVDEIAGALDRLLVDDAAAEALGRSGAERAAAFTWDRCAKETEALYAELAQR